MIQAHRSHALSPALLGVVIAAVLIAAGCSGPADPYADLSQSELAYVLPGSADWATGDPCAEADCNGEIESSRLSGPSWLTVISIDVPQGDVPERTTPVELGIGETLSGGPDVDRLVARVWGPDLAPAQEAMAAGHVLWIAVECPGLDADLACHLVAVDSNDRFAGIGYGAGLLFTAPLAREMTAEQAPSARSFLLDHFS